ncbi:MAG: cytochrome C, partial [Alphaproteobacteria bacterium]|nr:cytochrome C [Alphaproteobacteria bacterium]
QRASNLSASAGLRDSTGWCTIDHVTFESRLRPGVHVIGDAADLGPVPKTAFTAALSGRLAAHAIVAILRNAVPPAPILTSVLGALATPDYGFSAIDTFRLKSNRFSAAEPGGGLSPWTASAEHRKSEADVIKTWIRSSLGSIWGST